MAAWREPGLAPISSSCRRSDVHGYSSGGEGVCSVLLSVTLPTVPMATLLNHEVPGA